MILRSLHLHRNNPYQVPKPGEDFHFTGKAEFDGDFGSVSLNLNAETSRAILEVVAGQLVQTSKEVANNMTREVIEQSSGRLEHSA